MTLLPSCTAMTWVPTIGRRTPHTRTGQRSITQQARSLPSDVLAAGQTPMPLPGFVARRASPGFHVQKMTLTHRRVQHSRGPPCTASRAARRPEILLRYVFCAQLHCLALPFREHLPETHPAAEATKRTAALHDPAHRRPCHADSLLLAQAKPVSWQ